MTLLSAAALAFTGCAGEEDDIFPDSAANRLDQSKVTYTERLEASEAGWVMEYYPTTGVEGYSGMGYLILADFNKDGFTRVAMRNAFSGNNYLEDTSAWEVIADNGPVLTFNTYNECIHAFSDPAPNGSLGLETGRGAEGDYEFMIVDLPENAEMATMKGKKRGTYIRFTRLPEGTDFEQYINDVQAFNNRMFPTSAPNHWVYINAGDNVMKMEEASTGIPNIYPYDGDAITDESRHPFLITQRGGRYYFRFRDVLDIADGAAQVQEFVYDEEQDLFTCVDNPEFTITADEPLSFFNSAMQDDARMWRINSSSDVSSNFTTAMSAVRTAFSRLRYTFNDVRFTYYNGDFVCAVNYRPGSGSAVNAYYRFTMTETENGVNLAYSGAVNSSGEAILTTIPSLRDLLNCFDGTYTVTAATTKFNLSNIRFASGESKWFTVTIL